MRKVLVVTSSWRPVMIADMQRARMLCGHFREFGWEPEILAPDVSYQPPQCVEPDAVRFFDPITPFHPVAQYGAWFWNVIGSSTISWRGFLPVLREGSRLLSKGDYDLVFFSTSHSLLFLVGCFWKHRFGIPFVCDLHDPWYARIVPRPELRRGMRGRIWSFLMAWGERRVLTSVSGVISVSPLYLKAIDQHYGADVFAWQRARNMLFEPFGYEPDDRRQTSAVANWVRPAIVAYCGAGGRAMRSSWSLLCDALAALKENHVELLESVCFSLKGTSLHYRPGDSSEMMERAIKAGIGHIVLEDPSRVSYAESLRLIEEADAALLLGVNDPGYMASKLYSYLATEKPVLAIVRRGSVMLPELAKCAGVSVIEFDEHTEPSMETAAVLMQFFQDIKSRKSFDRSAVLSKRTAHAMSGRISEFFDGIASD